MLLNSEHEVFSSQTNIIRVIRRVKMGIVARLRGCFCGVLVNSHSTET